MDQPTIGDAVPGTAVVARTDASGYRYPGSPPFADTELDRLVFRGRATEVDTVLHSILSSDLFVLYAISGMGKTSLLNAGVLQQLRDRDLWPVVLRLNDPIETPVELIDAQIREAAASSDEVVVMRHPDADGNVAATRLWDLLSGLEVWKGNTLQQPVLIFDQFEELFTLDWKSDVRRQFITEFGEIIRRHPAPDAAYVSLTAPTLPPPSVKVVLVIREDSLGELDAFTVDVPQIMQHRFRLVGLEPRQAENAIREPALIDDQRLRSRRFAYTEDAARTLLEFLRTKKERDERVLTPTVDPSQLQIICQHLERSILPKKQQTADPEAIVEISLEDLGGEEGLNEILRDFYRREIEDFGSEDQALIRKLCEIGLISRSGRRLSLEEGEIQADFGVSSDLLDDLVDRRILRAEPRVGSVYYELAHDTLVAPILVYRGERVDKEREAAENLARGSRLDRWAFRLGLANLFLFGYIGGITAALSLLARRSPPMPRKGQWKARVALVISYFWMGIYTAILVFESDDPGLGLLFYLGIVLQTAIGTLVGIVWPVHGKRTRRSALVTIAGGLALAFTLLGLWGLFANYVSPDGALRIDRTSPAGSLSIGACFDDSAVAEIQDVDLLDCNEPHDYEIYAMVQLEGNEGAYPGDQSLFDELDQYCVDQFEAYVGRDYSSSKYFYTPFGPLEPEWARGDRGGICLLSLGIAKNTSSAFNSGQ